MEEYDVVVIGGGIAGIEAASKFADFNKKVALIEKDDLGGIAIKNGALQTKFILDYFKTYRDGTKEELKARWASDMKNLENLISNRLAYKNLDIYYGEGELISKNEVLVNRKTIRGEIIVIAIGTRPNSPFSLPLDEKYIISQATTVKLENIPKEITIIGGNMHGIELGSIYGYFGVKTTIIERETSILYGEDEDHIEAVRENFKNLNISTLEGRTVKDLELVSGKVRVIFENGDSYLTDQVLISDMRKPNLLKGTEKVGIENHSGYIRVDENFRTTVDNIYAIGDVNGILEMANIATEQAERLVDKLMGIKRERLSYELLPRGIFTEPEIAGVGFQERQCRVLKIPYKVGKCKFSETWGGWTKLVNDGFIKVILNRNDELLGVWAVGKNVTEYIGFFALLIEKKFTAMDIINNLTISPSIHETTKKAAYRAMHSSFK